MFRMIAFCTVAFFSLLVPQANSLTSSKIDPLLQERLSQNQNEFQKVIIRLTDRLDKNALSRSLALSSYTRQAAHCLAVQTLKEHARKTQASLIAFLESEKLSKDVREIKSYWIDNLISVELKGDLVFQLSDFAEVERIFPDMAMPIFPPHEELQPLSLGVTSIRDNLKVIGADSAWHLGYTGKGTLVCSFDTGVEGVHPALFGNYRGNFGYSHQQCWFDPLPWDTLPIDTFPHVFEEIPQKLTRAHGTSTMGIMVGKDNSTGDTVGVAFEAQWIAAGIIDIPNVNFMLDGFQWAADPDGDPNTVEDVPDVLSNSWGYPQDYLECSDIFSGPIDNLEALGVIVMFAAGNAGPDYNTLTNPANRADSPYNTFAVGMITNDYNDPVVDGMSSRGPSQCNPVIIKPNVVAPGREIACPVPVSLYPSGYGFGTGTSYACPHAAGAALILRQYNPNAPVDSIKKALMLSATDIAQPGPDSIAGYGLINIPAALKILAPNNQPNIYIKSVTYPETMAGDTIEIIVSLKNNGLGLLNVAATMRTDRSDVVLLDSSSTYGNIALDSSRDNSADPYKIHFVSTIPKGTLVTLDLHITGSDSYSHTIPIYILVGPRQEAEIFTHDAGNFKFTISNFGQYGLAPGSVRDKGGVGFIYPKLAGVSNLYEMALLIESDSDHVSDGARNMLGVPDMDFEVAPDGALKVYSPCTRANQCTYSSFTDANAINPLGLEIFQQTYAYDTDYNDHFTLLVYIIKNISDTTLNNLIVSIFADWDFLDGSNTVDRTGFDRDAQIGYMWHYNHGECRGIQILNHEGIRSYRSIDGVIWLRNGFSRSEKWQFASEGFVDTANTTPADYSHMISTGPFTLAPGHVDTAAFAVLAADTVPDLLQLYAPKAALAYADFLTDVNDEHPPTIPREFTLAQNYPNPFNPATIIEFELEKSQQVRLEIFNLLGQRVQTLIDDRLPAGKHRILWDSSKSPHPLSSGIYFYRLSGETQNLARKMLLLK